MSADTDVNFRRIVHQVATAPVKKPKKGARKAKR